MSKSYKASTNFSFAGKNYVEGQEIDITDEDVLAKLESRQQISSGKGKSAADVETERHNEYAKKSAAADKQRQEEADAREKEFLAQGGKPKSSVRTMRTDDQTQGIKEKNEKAGPNDPKK